MGLAVKVDSAIRWLLAEEAEEIEAANRRFLLHCFLIALGLGIACGCGFGFMPVQWSGFVPVTEMGRAGIEHRTEKRHAAAAVRMERSRHD
jgi:hypothetical protein